MSNIVNEPKNNMTLIRMLRTLFEHRALWMYFLCDEARKKGLDPEQFAPGAIRRCGIFHGNSHIEGKQSKSLKILKKKLFKLPGRAIFEMKIRRSTDDNFDVDFYYCPLINAWRKQGCSNDEMERMCEWAMWGDRGIAESFGCELDLLKTIARGDGKCEIRFRRKNPDEPRNTGESS